LYPPEYEGHFESLLISSEKIEDRAQALAKILAQDYQGKRPILLCTLKGACPFFIHLCGGLQKQRQGYDFEFVRASSYEGTDSTGSVSLLGELKLESLRNRHVLIVEDIVDTGTTLSTLVPLLKEKGKSATIEVCTLLDKRLGATSEKKSTAKYCGFSIPNAFVIGYGYDACFFAQKLV